MDEQLAMFVVESHRRSHPSARQAAAADAGGDADAEENAETTAIINDKVRRARRVMGGSRAGDGRATVCLGVGYLSLTDGSVIGVAAHRTFSLPTAGEQLGFECVPPLPTLLPFRLPV